MYGNLRIVLAVFAFSTIHSSPARVGETLSTIVKPLSSDLRAMESAGVKELALLRETETESPRPWGGALVENCIRN